MALLEAIINRQVDCCDHTPKLAADTWQTCRYRMYLQCAEASRINGAYYLNGRGGVVPWLLLPDGSKIWLDDTEFYLPVVLWLLSVKDGNFRELESSAIRFKAE